MYTVDSLCVSWVLYYKKFIKRQKKYAQYILFYDKEQRTFLLTSLNHRFISTSFPGLYVIYVVVFVSISIYLSFCYVNKSKGLTMHEDILHEGLLLE